MNTESIKNRIRAIKGQLKENDINCLIITKPANVTCSTGFLGDDSWALIINGRSFLVTDSRYTEQAQKECPDCNIIERTKPMIETVSNLIEKYKTIKTISIESSTSVFEFKLLKKVLKNKLKTSSGIIENIRLIKDNLELNAIKKAASIASDALVKTLPLIKSGMTESELAGLLDFQIRKLGSINSFDTIVAFGANASIAHHMPGMKKLRQNDTILIDFGAKYKGYCSDITRCFTIGKVSSLYKDAFEIVERAQSAAIEKVKAGVSIKEVDLAAREVIRKSGLPVYGHGTGHGLGIEIHESPFIKSQIQGIFEAGQVVTIEPGIYIPGKLGIRIEDDILVTKTGCKILTKKCPYLPNTIL